MRKMIFLPIIVLLLLLLQLPKNITGMCLKCYTSSNNINNDIYNSKMISTIKWYKSTISPLMPKNCRFLPTCSSYGIEALEKYGNTKGLILTAWRIIRCNPTGGYGYDPVQWPPVNYFYPNNINSNK